MHDDVCVMNFCRQKFILMNVVEYCLDSFSTRMNRSDNFDFEHLTFELTFMKPRPISSNLVIIPAL